MHIGQVAPRWDEDCVDFMRNLAEACGIAVSPF
jgi:hypothetical protein